MAYFIFMRIIKITIFVMLALGIGILVLASAVLITQEKIILFECSPEFWKNNLDLWSVLGVDYNADFDQTFGKDYFEPDITLLDAINSEGVGMDHLAQVGTTAYLNALADPEIDEKTISTAVYFGYVHQLDNYIENCKDVKRSVP